MMSEPAGLYPIGRLSTRFGVSHRTLRFYEERGLLHPEHRGNRRFFSESDVVRLQVILRAKRFGLTLGEIRDLIDDRSASASCPQTASDLALGKDEVERRLDALRRQRLELDAAIAELRAALAAMERAAGADPDDDRKDASGEPS